MMLRNVFSAVRLGSSRSALLTRKCDLCGKFQRKLSISRPASDSQPTYTSYPHQFLPPKDDPEYRSEQIKSSRAEGSSHSPESLDRSELTDFSTLTSSENGSQFDTARHHMNSAAATLSEEFGAESSSVTTEISDESQTEPTIIDEIDSQSEHQTSSEMLDHSWPLLEQPISHVRAFEVDHRLADTCPFKLHDSHEEEELDRAAAASSAISGGDWRDNLGSGMQHITSDHQSSQPQVDLEDEEFENGEDYECFEKKELEKDLQRRAVQPLFKISKHLILRPLRIRFPMKETVPKSVSTRVFYSDGNRLMYTLEHLNARTLASVSLFLDFDLYRTAEDFRSGLKDAVNLSVAKFKPGSIILYDFIPEYSTRIDDDKMRSAQEIIRNFCHEHKRAFVGTRVLYRPISDMFFLGPRPSSSLFRRDSPDRLSVLGLQLVLAVYTSDMMTLNILSKQRTLNILSKQRTLNILRKQRTLNILRKQRTLNILSKQWLPRRSTGEEFNNLNLDFRGYFD